MKDFLSALAILLTSLFSSAYLIFSLSFSLCDLGALIFCLVSFLYEIFVKLSCFIQAFLFFVLYVHFLVFLQGAKSISQLKSFFSLLESSCLALSCPLLVFRSFKVTVPVTKLWSLASSAPLFVLASCSELLHFVLTRIWSIWLVVPLSSEIQVFLWISL